MESKITTKDFIERAIQVHGNKYDYSHTVYVSSKGKVNIVCPKHGEFEQRASSHLDGCGCPKCAREWSDSHKANHIASSRRSRGMTTDEWIQRAKSVHGDKYDYSETVYVNQRTKVKIICRKHGPFTQQAGSHLRGIGCKVCGYELVSQYERPGWTDEQREKIKATCLERYGAERYLASDEGRRRNTEIRSNPEFRSKMHQIIASSEVQAKIKSTCIEKYGVSSAMSLPETIDKVHASKIRNHSWNTSKPEEVMYVLLCDVFGLDDVVRQYKESRYPFHCDFYIKSLDLFIELNATWLHGGRWFDASDSRCVSILDKWRLKLSEGHKFYEVAINVWTVRDVAKRNVALANNLNYLVFWKNDLSDFNEWLDSNPLVLNDISN